VLLRERRRWQHVAGDVEDARRMQVLHDQRRDLAEGSELLLAAPVAEPWRIAGGEIQGLQLAIAGVASCLVEAEDLALEVTQDRLDAEAVGALLGADRELDRLDDLALAVLRKAIVLADDRDPAEIELRVGGIALDQLRQQIRFFTGEVRRQHGAE